MVPSVEETAAWYEHVLGWVAHYDAFDAQGRCVFGSVSAEAPAADDERDFKGFNLSRTSVEDHERTAQPRTGSSPWIFVDDVDQAYARVLESGVAPDSAPEDQPWGGRSFRLRDVNGLRLTFVEMRGDGEA